MIARCPYLGPGFEFRQKRPGEAPWVEDIVFCTFASTVSAGPTGMSLGIPRLVHGLTRALWTAQADRMIEVARDLDKADLAGDPLVATRAASRWDDDCP